MSLKPLVNDKKLYDSFLEEIDERIELARKELEQASELESVFRSQGQITALRKLKMLREKANGSS
jgi:hypothetical protein